MVHLQSGVVTISAVKDPFGLSLSEDLDARFEFLAKCATSMNKIRTSRVSRPLRGLIFQFWLNYAARSRVFFVVEVTASSRLSVFFVNLVT